MSKSKTFIYSTLQTIIQQTIEMINMYNKENIVKPIEIATKIENKEAKAICIVQNHENKSEAVAYVSDRLFTFPIQIEYNFETLTAIKNAVNEECFVFVFTDKELQDAWIDSYLDGGISEDRFDRRTEFHKFDEIHEIFCIDRMTLMEIRGDFDGTEWEASEWKKGIIAWYKNQAI